MAGTSTLSGSGWTANPTPDQRYPTIWVPIVSGKPAAQLGSPSNLAIDPVARKLYENVAGTWSAGTSY
ncbi:hypothetical protein [Burkholderia plantarii]|uniref:hypothetical protein n=1 Tax=Burkholderia plantarii TaxID=41899 RepID=UPI000870882A|nr:hypothetical protein [Burkholderia plantarii]WLE60291.1 hypothetical protein GIY62_06445 [Burkholderia plantarii]